MFPQTWLTGSPWLSTSATRPEMGTPMARVHSGASGAMMRAAPWLRRGGLDQRAPYQSAGGLGKGSAHWDGGEPEQPHGEPDQPDLSRGKRATHQRQHWSIPLLTPAPGLLLLEVTNCEGGMTRRSLFCTTRYFFKSHFTYLPACLLSQER